MKSSLKLLLSRIFKKKEKSYDMPIDELFDMAEAKGIKIHALTRFCINGYYYHVIDNDIQVVREGSWFSVEDENNPQNEFIYWVAAEICPYCSVRKRTRFFKLEYGVCDRCFYEIEFMWTKDDGDLKEFIDAQILIKTLSNL